MRTVPATLLAATCAAAIAGLAVAAQQPAGRGHTLTVQLPDGAVATINYSGDVPPKIVVGPAPAGFASGGAFGPAVWPVFASPEMNSESSPFAMMQRMSAEMDREAAALLSQAGGASGAIQTGLAQGEHGFSFASTLSGSGVCMQSVEITSQGDGRQPKVVRRTSGDCGRAAPGVGPAGVTAVPRAQAPASDSGPRYYQTSWRRNVRPSPSDATLRTVSDAAD